jgi:hypothetical protein
MTVSPRITPIIGTFFLGSPSQVAAGATWYKRANDECHRLWQSHNVSLRTAAGVVAALSPNNAWDRNIADANALCAAYCTGDGADDARQVKVCTFNGNKEKAIRILEGEEPLSVLGGLKVRSFFLCILGGGKAVCVDGHAFSIWAGERVATSATPSISTKLYNEIAADYVTATDMINSILSTDYSPAQVQAITWVVHRDLYKGQRTAKQSTKKGASK